MSESVMPPNTILCTRSDHPSDVHGHYGYGGRYWCRDMYSPLLSEENMGDRRRFAKPVTPAGVSDEFRSTLHDGGGER